MAPLKIFTNQNTMHYNGDIQMADINQQERDEFQALIRGYGQGPRSFTANAGVQSDPVGGLTPVGQAIGKGIDTVSDIAKSTADALSTIANTPISVTNDDGTTTVSPFGQQGNTFQAIGQLGQSLPNALPASFVSNTDRLFLYNNDQLRANEALRIAKTLNIGADTVMFGDDKAFERADYLSRRAERGQVLQDIYDEFPELYKVKYGSQAEGIQALNNIESIKNTKGIFDSIQQSIWAMNDQMKLGDVGFALAYESDPQKISELTAEVNRLQNNLQNYRRPDGGSPLEEILGSTSSQIYMMGKQGGTGAIVGGIIGGIGGGIVSGGSAAIPTAMTGAKWLGSADMAYEMYKMSFGNKYLELIGKRDQKGNRVYSNEEAKEYAMSFAAIDAGIEFVATRAIGKAATKIAPKSALVNAVSRGTSNAAETFNRGIGVTAAQVAKSSIKAGAPELFEEGLQDVNEKLQHNLWRKSNDQEGPYSAGDMFVGAGEAMWQALPAVVGFGAIGGGISGVRTMKAFRDFQKLSPEEQHMAVMEEQNRNGHVIMQNLKNDAAANNLAKENPELYGKIVQAQGDNIVVSTAYVNVNEMAETEEGQAAIRNMVDAGLVTQEDVSKAITADAPIEIPIGSYAQLSGGLSEETVKALEESSYFTRGGLSMKTLERAKEEVHAMKDLVKDDTEKRAERVKNDIIRSYFDEISDIDKEMLDMVLADPTHIKQTFNNVYKELTEQYREQYTSDFDAMDTDLETARTSGVNPTWLGENKPPRSNSERRRMAYQSSLARTQSTLADNPEALNQAGAHYADMEHALKQIESLESMRDKLFELADNDIALRMQLSKSGYEVYQSLKSIMSDETVDRKQRDTAEANALLMAQHADVMADIIRRAGRGNYTAMDYFNTVRVQMNGGAYNNGYAQPLQMQQKIETAIKNWGQVVDDQLSGKQINRTVQIMDSPLVLQMLGFDGAVMIDPSIIHKVITGKHANQISIDDIKLLPKKIANPVAVFKNYNGRSQKAVPDEAILVLDMYAKNGNPNINASGENIQVVVTFTKTANGTNINKIKTITPRRNINWYNQQIANGNLLYANTKKINRLVTGSRQQMAQPVTKQFIINNSIPNENDLDKLRKQYNYQYYQAAWHGSPYDFDEFDLGAIGSGEGNQVHGWGLYFAKDKKVSDLYRRELSLIHDVDKGTLFKVDVPDTKTMIDEQQSLNILSKETKQNLNAAINALPEQEKEVFINEYTNSPLFNHYAKKEIDELDSKFNQLDDEYRLLKDKYLDEFLKEDLNTITQRNLNRLSEKYNIDLNALKENPNTIKDIKNQLDTMWFNALVELGTTKEKYRESYWGKYKKDFSALLNDGGINGRDFYLALSKALGSAKQASVHLNEYGVKGITYIGAQDGRCYVVFDDKAIKVIEKYNQSINGMTTINSPTDRLIQIFKTADRSTFLHEMGHVFFDDIKNLAEMENAPEQLVTDWNKLKEWSEWDDIKGADNTKAHEKFARGWEAYLREGKAPTKGLQRVFRMFSKWLTRIYRAVTRLGGLPPKEIQDIMARMIAAQEDIDAYTKEQALEQFESSKLFKQLDEAEQAKVQGYIADVGEMAKERVMKRYMKELESRPIKEWNDEKDTIQADIEKRLMEQYPIYKDHQRYNAYGKDALTNTRYGTLKELESAEREQTGFTFDEAVNQAMESAEQAFIENNHIGKSNIEIAEEWILFSDGQMKLTEEEARIIKSQTNRDLANNWELLDRLNRLDPNSETIESDLEPIVKRFIGDNEKVAKELGIAVKELDSAQDRIEKLKAQLQERINNVRAIRDSGIGVISDYMNRAKQELGDLTLSQASQYKKYQNQAIREGKRADRALAVNKLEEALQAKQLQLLNQARARVAFDNALRIKKLRTKLLDNLNRMTRPKNPITIEPNMRYFYAHMAYQMGLTKYDGLEPVDGFNMNAVINALDPDADLLNVETSFRFDNWIIQTFNSEVPLAFKNLTVSQLNSLEELMTGIYKSGKRDYDGVSLKNNKGDMVSSTDAALDILTTASNIFGKITESTINKENNKSFLDATLSKFANGMLELTQMKTILRRLDGGKGGPAETYIYDTINRAKQQFNERIESATLRMAKDIAIYSKRELNDIRNIRGYQVGDLYGLTKEKVIVLALNWGTQNNRQRAMATANCNEVEMERLFQEVLNDKDWEFIIKTWDHINSFYKERSKVQEELYGNPLKKEEGITFSIGGRTIDGQYYPIVYDPKTSSKSSNQQVEDVAMQMMSSNAVFGFGMSATKSRMNVVQGKQLLLDFDVIPKALTEAVNHITMRQPVIDVNRLLSNKELADYITNKFGSDTYQYMKQWVRDQWASEVSRLSELDNWISILKRNAGAAVMAGNLNVSIQNIANLPVAIQQQGASIVFRAIRNAGLGIYGKGTRKNIETREFVFGKSFMMRERVQTLDKDMRKGLSIGGKGLSVKGVQVGGYKLEQAIDIKDTINNFGYSIIAETDLMLSIPLWKEIYDVELSKLIETEGVSVEWADQRAIEKADKAIIDVFGTGDVKDQAAIQRRKGSFANFVTAFYTYANTLWNMQLDAFYALKDRGDWQQFISVLLWDLMMQAVINMVLKAITNGDDDDPEKMAKSFVSEFVSQSTMGIPLVRDAISNAMRFIMGERGFTRGNGPLAYSIIDKLEDVYTSINSNKRDFTDVGRAVGQVTNRIIGFSDTASDAIFTLAKYGLTDIDAELEDLLFSVMFNKRLKSKKEKKKQ
nr:MAG TPA: crystallin beta/gamma motif-containing protein [Caudoviricetes sp.]